MSWVHPKKRQEVTDEKISQLRQLLDGPVVEALCCEQRVPLWQLWSPHSVKISAAPEDASCLFKPHFVVRVSDGHPIVLDVHLPSLNRWTACSEQPCPNRYHEPSVHDWVYINSLKLNAESLSPVNQQAVEEFARNNPRTPPSETQPTTTESPETPYQAYRSAHTSPAAKTSSFKLPDPDTDPEGEEEEDDDEEEEVVQSLSVRSASPEQATTLPPFSTLHSALVASAPLISAQRISSSGRSTPTNPATFVSRPIHPPLHTSRQLEDTSDAPSSEQKPPTSTQPTTLPSSASQTTDNFTMSAADLAKLQEQQNQLTTAISTLVNHLTAAKTSSSKSPVKAPEPFHGKAEDARRFLQFFTNWAGHQPQLKKDDGTRDDKEWISTALSYMHGEAGRWASRFLQQIADHDADSTKPWPFAGGKWANFLTEFKQRFQPANDAQAALQELEQLTLGRGTVADFASRFVDIFSRTNLSDSDGMARFKRKLSQEHLLWLALSNLIKEPANLEELVAQAIKNEFVMRNMNPNSSRTSLAQYAPAPTPAPARDPYAMEIDATRPGPSGKTYQDFLNAMRGRCFGCGSTGHNKKDGNHGALRCNYCQRMGHAATVCQDKYMGFPPGRGLSRPPRRRVAATQEAPFSLFDEPAPAASATVAATTPAAPPAPAPAPAPTLASLSATQQQQLELLAQLQRLHQGF
ncbi:hypothetical protein CC2G_004513 [Coprinopsis cinerea AmutBmut pab1-1]|nr:hypothetical protein CC2G_004513 [Coprinopsis cinerea AmutBmut pab1-1]